MQRKKKRIEKRKEKRCWHGIGKSVSQKLNKSHMLDIKIYRMVGKVGYDANAKRKIKQPSHPLNALKPKNEKTKQNKKHKSSRPSPDDS